MMTLEDAIKHCEEKAQEQDMLAKRCDDASGYTRSHNESIRTKEAKKRCKCAAEHRQLAAWLKELKGLRESLNNGDLRGCENCKYNYVDIIDYPCSECERTDLWEVAVDEES